MAGRKRNPYADLRDREYFHIMMNLESYPDFLPTALALARGYLEAARKRQTDPDLEPELCFFPYTRSDFEARLDQIYQGLVDDVNRYEAQHSWTMRTRDDVIAWMRQMAPFNQTDGAWLRNIAPVGPMDPVRALLFEIWIEELGSGDPQLNHANMYTALLESVDVYLPDIRTREYADNPDLLDSAFTLPLFQLVVSQFPQTFFPELLGINQYLEWSSVELKNMVRLHEYFGLDPHFYEVHVAIDNAAAGHGAKAKRAIQLYLEQVRTDLGERAMQAEWERIWNGYVAFATTGNLAQEMRETRLHQPTPAEKVAAVVRSFAPKARLNHGRKRLGGTLLNDLFAEPERLMAALVASGMVVPGDPDGSPFFALLAPDGPMFKVFTPAQIATWQTWVRSLPPAGPGAGTATPATSAVPAISSEATTAAVAAVPAPPAERMLILIDAMRGRQDGEPAHEAQKLIGPDPTDPGRSVTQPVGWWFRQPNRAFMRALANPDNGWVTPGNAGASRLVTEILREDNAMARALSRAAPGPDGGTWATVITEWIDADCPIPAEQQDDPPPRPLTLLTPADRVDAHPTGRIHGSGSVH
jgi:hypothetical protein